jgi:ribosome biogenesis GTPase
MNSSLSLSKLGWKPSFIQQLSLDEYESCQPARVVEQHRTRLELRAENGVVDLELIPAMPAITVGDWLLLNNDHRFVRLLERSSLFSRKAPGSKIDEQLIAANINTAFIVCSLNDDFNLSRIERYLAMVNQAGAEPVVVLSKVDLEPNVSERVAEVRALDPMLAIEAINGLDNESVDVLLPWCSEGQTIALLGSSGSGKSTLSNTLLQAAVQETGGIRENDSKGRHTTTRRSLLEIPSGAMILDTPGMRELQLAACEEGLQATFSDIDRLSQQCQFADCQHTGQMGCAITAALESGELEQRRLDNYLKLQREQALNASSLAQRRASERGTSKYIRQVQRESKGIKRGG